MHHTLDLERMDSAQIIASHQSLREPCKQKGQITSKRNLAHMQHGYVWINSAPQVKKYITNLVRNISFSSRKSGLPMQRQPGSMRPKEENCEFQLGRIFTDIFSGLREAEHPDNKTSLVNGRQITGTCINIYQCETHQAVSKICHFRGGKQAL